MYCHFGTCYQSLAVIPFPMILMHSVIKLYNNNYTDGNDSDNGNDGDNGNGGDNGNNINKGNNG